MLDVREAPAPIRLTRRRRPDGRARVFTTLSQRDAAAWHRVAGRVARVIEPALGPGVLANRVRFSRASWRLEDLDEAIARARGAGRRLPRGLVLQTDVESFYDSVTPPLLAGSLLDAGLDPAEAARAADLLAGWRELGCPGLPVGPPGSAVMANALLLAVDRSLGPRPFLRWVDDYRVPVASSQDAEAVLRRIDRALEGQGLRRSRTKTRIGPAEEIAFPGSASGGA